MAKILSMPASGGASNLKDIIKDGVLNTAYAATGTITQQADHVAVERTTNSSGGEIVGVDFTDIDTLTLDLQNATSTPRTIKMVVGAAEVTGTTTAGLRQTVTLNVSAITGVQNITLTVTSGEATCKVFNLLGA